MGQHAADIARIIAITALAIICVTIAVGAVFDDPRRR